MYRWPCSTSAPPSAPITSAELICTFPAIWLFISRKRQPLSARSLLDPSPTPRATWIPDLPDRQPSRKQQSAHRSRRENTVRRLPNLRPIAPEGQTSGTSWGAPRRDRTNRFPDPAQDRARRCQIPRSALPPLDLHRALPFSRSRETRSTTSPPKREPARGCGGLVADLLFRGQPFPAANGSRPVDEWRTRPRSTACIRDGRPAIRRQAVKHLPEQHRRSG